VLELQDRVKELERQHEQLTRESVLQRTRAAEAEGRAATAEQERESATRVLQSQLDEEREWRAREGKEWVEARAKLEARVAELVGGAAAQLETAERAAEVRCRVAEEQTRETLRALAREEGRVEEAQRALRDAEARAREAEGRAEAAERAAQRLSSRAERSRREVEDALEAQREEVRRLGLRLRVQDGDVTEGQAVAAEYEARLAASMQRHEGAVQASRAEYQARIRATVHEYEARLVREGESAEEKVAATARAYRDRMEAAVSEHEARLQATVHEYEGQIREAMGRYEARLAERDATVASRDGRIAALEADLEAASGELGARVAALEGEREGLAAEVAAAQARAAGAEARVGELRAELEAAAARLEEERERARAGLEAAVAEEREERARDAEEAAGERRRLEEALARERATFEARWDEVERNADRKVQLAEEQVEERVERAVRKGHFLERSLTTKVSNAALSTSVQVMGALAVEKALARAMFRTQRAVELPAAPPARGEEAPRAEGAGESPAPPVTEGLSVLQAAFEGDARAIEALQAARHPLDEREDESGCTPLHKAAAGGHAAAAGMLVRLGASLAAADSEGNTPLHTAAMCGSAAVLDAVASEVDALVLRAVGGGEAEGGAEGAGEGEAAGSDGEDGAPPPRDPRPSLVEVRARLVELAGPNSPLLARGPGGKTPLHMAAMVDSPGAVRALVRLHGAARGARLSAEGGWAERPRGRRGLLSASALTQADDTGLTALHCAAIRGSHVCLEEIAAAARGEGALDEVLGAGVRPAREGAGGGAAQGASALHLAAGVGALAAVASLVTAGARMDARDGDGRSVLHWAAMSGHHFILGYLLENSGATDPADLRSHEGLTPFHEVAATGDLRAMRLLVSRSRRGLTVATRTGASALHYAAMEGRERVLWHMWASVPESLQRMFVNMEGEVLGSKGMTPLHCAAAFGNARCCALLCFFMGAGAVSSVAEGQSPLMVARRSAAAGDETLAVLERAARAQAAPGWRPLGPGDTVTLPGGDTVSPSQFLGTDAEDDVPEEITRVVQEVLAARSGAPRRAAGGLSPVHAPGRARSLARASPGAGTPSPAGKASPGLRASKSLAAVKRSPSSVGGARPSRPSRASNKEPSRDHEAPAGGARPSRHASFGAVPSTASVRAATKASPPSRTASQRGGASPYSVQPRPAEQHVPGKGGVKEQLPRINSGRGIHLDRVRE